MTAFGQFSLFLKGMLFDGHRVVVICDARRPEVDVPPHLRGERQCGLRLSTRPDFLPSIPDLKIDEQGVVASLSFGGYLYRCVVPWTAIFALKDEDADELMVIQQNVPADVNAQPEPAATATATEPATDTVQDPGVDQPIPGARPKLKLVD